MLDTVYIVKDSDSEKIIDVFADPDDAAACEEASPNTRYVVEMEVKNSYDPAADADEDILDDQGYDALSDDEVLFDDRDEDGD